MKKTLAVLLACFAFLLSTPSVAEWVYEEDIDGMTDEDASMAVTFKGRSELIMVKCTGSDSYGIVVGVGEFVGSDGRTELVYRVDDHEPVNAGGGWRINNPGTAVFAPNHWKEGFLEALTSGNEILVQVEDYRGSKPRSLFSLAGSSDAINQLNCL